MAARTYAIEAKISDQDKQKFRTNYVQGGENDCWLWEGKTSGTYGAFYINKVRMLAHRIAFIIANGPVQTVVWHTCPNEKCVNPRHLKTGPSQEYWATLPKST